MDYTVKLPWLTLTGSLMKGQFGDGQLALALMTPEGPERLSTNLIAYGLVAPEGHTYVKDSSEHAGLPDALVEAGIATKVEQVAFGPFDATGWLMKVIV